MQQEEVAAVEESASGNGVKSAPDAHCSSSSSSSSTKDTTTKGRHRITVELKKLEQEAKFLQDELDELEKTVGVSNLCPELLQTVGSTPDPLLPITTGLCNPSWDRWFQGPFDSHGSGCWIL